MIELIHLEKAFEDVTPLRDVNAVINKGDVIAVIGPSGCGKSTLLRCINLLDPPTAGQILVDGEDITVPGYDRTKVNQRIGMVFQRWNLFGHLTAVENVMRPQMDVKKVSKQDAFDKAMIFLRRVGLAEKAMNYPEELSGGQQQRVAIARTLAMDPEIILLDEPTSALDPGMVGEVKSVIKDLADDGATMLIVTHEMAFAREVSNRVFYLDEGVLYEDGTPEQIFENPQRRKTQRFIRRSKTVEIDITSRDFDFRGALSTIDDYCIRNRISRHINYQLWTVFEELCVRTLLPMMGDRFHMRAELVYEEITGYASIKVYYDGPANNPAQTHVDDVAWKMLEAQTSSIMYSKIDEEGFTNMMNVHILCE